MASNDSILIDGIIDNIIQDNHLSNTNEYRGKVYEEFAITEVLKSYDLTHDQLTDGLVDGGDDGGIDGLFYFVNGAYIADKSIHTYPKTNAILEIYVITCKHHDTYELSPLESVDSSVSELFNMSISTDNLNSKYKKEIIKKRELLVYLYRKLAPALEKCLIHVQYISRGVSTQVAENIYLKGEKIKATCNELFLGCITDMQFLGAKEILTHFRKKRNSAVELTTRRLFQNNNNFVALVTLTDYYKFISDENGKLKRYYFEENVRDYLGDNRTNRDIINTLSNSESPDFWLLNNGITILSSSAVSYDGKIEVENIQIVNGLQTTNSIYQFFANGGTDINNRCLLIKVIVSIDEQTRKEIIQATNNQSTIPLYSLHATDKIQKDIEDALYKNNLYYERKDKYYHNLGYPDETIFTPLYLAGGYVSLILKLPHRSVLLKSKFMNNPVQYNKVFSEKTDIRVWSKIAIILQKTDNITPLYKGNIKTSNDKYLRSVRPIVSLVAISRLIGKYSFGVNDLASFDTDLLTDSILEDVVKSVIECVNDENLGPIRNLSTRNKSTIVLNKLAAKYGISDFEGIAHRSDFIYDEYEVTDDFIDVIAKKLPAQPWPIGIHKSIASELGCKNSKVSQTIQILIKNGTFKKQKNGQVIS